MIYIASKLKHMDKWKKLRSKGVTFISTWIDEPNYINKNSPELVGLWEKYIKEASSAKALIAYLEPGEIMKGALVEIGAALAHNVPVFLVGEFDGSWQVHPLCKKCGTIKEAIEEVSKL